MAGSYMSKKRLGACGGLCGLEKPQPTKKGLPGSAATCCRILDGAVGDEVIAGAFAVALEHEDLVGVRGALVCPAGSGGSVPSGHGNARGRNVHLRADGGGVHGFDVAVEVGPGGGVVEAGVEELAAAQGGVAVLRKRCGRVVHSGCALTTAAVLPRTVVSRGMWPVKSEEREGLQSGNWQ